VEGSFAVLHESTNPEYYTRDFLPFGMAIAEEEAEVYAD
jgi:hypothetical protein